MDDNALAPVIAVMLILAIGVTVFAVYTSTYLPSLKQQDEVDHLQQVESGFLKFSSDIDNAIAAGKNGINVPDQPVEYSETIPLGGGDIIVNSMKSGGIVRIQNNESPFLNITITYDNYSHTYETDLVNYSYIPNGNFWIDQGYLWEAGNVTVTQLKGQRSAQITENDKFPGSLIQYYPKDDGIHINFVNFSIEKSSGSISGNGNAILKLKSTVKNLTPSNNNITTIILSAPESHIINGLLTNITINNDTPTLNSIPNGLNISYSTPHHLIINEIEMQLKVQ
jgi:hypothetical protein